MKLLFMLLPTLPQHMLSLRWNFNGCVKWPMSLDAFFFFSPRSIGMFLFFSDVDLWPVNQRYFVQTQTKSQKGFMKKCRRLCEFVTATQTGRFSGLFRLPMLAKIDNSESQRGSNRACRYRVTQPFALSPAQSPPIWSQLVHATPEQCQQS